MQFVHKNLLCFMKIIIFQLLSCLYLYDLGIPVPVRIRKQIRYTGFWPVALITLPPVYRLLAVVLITVPPVYRLLASKGLRNIDIKRYQNIPMHAIMILPFINSPIFESSPNWDLIEI